MSGFGVDGDQRGIARIKIRFIFGAVFFDDPLGLCLEIVIERRHHLEPFLGERAVAVEFFKIFADIKDEVRRTQIAARLRQEFHGGGARLLVLALRDKTVFLHLEEHQVLPALQKVAVVAVRGIAGGRLRKRRQVCRLGEREVRGVDAEERAARFFDAVEVAAVGGFVQVEVEDDVFRDCTVELDRKYPLFDLADERLVFGQKRIFDDLLGDGRTALGEASLYMQFDEDIGKHGADDRRDLDPIVLVKPLILDRYRRVLDIAGDVLEGDDRAPDVVMEVIEDDLAGAVIDLGRLHDLALFKRGEVGKRHGCRPQHQGAGGEEAKSDRTKQEVLVPMKQQSSRTHAFHTSRRWLGKTNYGRVFPCGFGERSPSLTSKRYANFSRAASRRCILPRNFWKKN